ncbi:NAD-dependent epimerase/dehydratase family protein [Siccirubricoccus sp. KC 17139]|uniref:NAD-dependent epimerase/dehydratase family protein n=1 Tax=Siccirubricoccus soli TaxID=2899147 RepID=A0ABT1DCS2_9PROT|nr:NAD-dependent epimerase/dehydratase family protein [Siccirubricoccus soli]MCP2685155.1 NAD-dependent epimerase/dehydratase family protein [Siccirubricoccus soli]
MAWAGKVVGFDALPLPPRTAREFAGRPGRWTMVQGDLGTDAAPDTAFALATAWAVIHAAIITAGTAREREAPERIAEAKVGGAISALRAARRSPYLSSGMVHGEPPADGGQEPCPLGRVTDGDTAWRMPGRFRPLETTGPAEMGQLR